MPAADFLTFNWISLYIFVLVMFVLILTHRKKMDFQRMLFPLFYAGLWRTNFGLKFINRFGTKHKEGLKIFGLCGIGIGFAGMVLILWAVIQSVFVLFTQPQAEAGVALVLPQTNIPGLGFLPFWYWLIALFVLILIHEFSHGLVAKAYGLKVKNSGLGFFGITILPIPLAFVEPDEKAMEKMPDHVQYSVFAAGPFSNILTAIIILLLFMWVFTPITTNISTEDGITFTAMEGYPAEALPSDLTIRSINGEETLTGEQFLKTLQKLDAGQEIILSDGIEQHTLTLAANPDTGRGFLGVTNILVTRKSTINAAVYGIFTWITGLFKWTAWLSLFIGIANLLPLGPVDGGRMLKILLERTSKGHGTRLWASISVFVLMLLLISLSFWVKGLF